MTTSTGNEQPIACQRQHSSDLYHCHNGQPAPDHVDRRARRVLMGAAGICLLFMVAEVVGGLMVSVE